MKTLLDAKERTRTLSRVEYYFPDSMNGIQMKCSQDSVFLDDNKPASERRSLSPCFLIEIVARISIVSDERFKATDSM